MKLIDFVFIGISFLACLFLYNSLSLGVGVSPDSVVYLSVANNIRKGLGVVQQTDFDKFEQLKHFPPLYPYILSFFEQGNIKFLNSVCLFITLVGSWVLLRQLFLIPIAILGYTALLCCPAIWNVHFMAWSEVPFLAFLVLTFLSLYFLTKSTSEFRVIKITAGNGIDYYNYLRLILVIIFSLSCFLLRYSGITVVCACLLVLFFELLSKNNLREKITNILIYILFYVLIFCLFIIPELNGAREFAYHPPAIDLYQKFLSVKYFIFPFEFVGANILLSLIAIALFFQRKVNWFFAIFLIGYIALIVLTLTFFDSQVPINERMLLPLIFSMIFALCTAISFISTRLLSWKYSSIIAIPLAVMIVGCNAPKIMNKASKVNSRGLFLNSVIWKNSPIIKWAKENKVEATLFSNAPDILSFHTGQFAKFLPKKFFPLTGKVNPTFKEELEILKSSNSEIICFKKVRWRRYLPSCDELVGSYGFKVQVDFQEHGGLFE